MPQCSDNKCVPMVDLTKGVGKHRHYWCMSCGAHVWSGQVWTKQEWQNRFGTTDADEVDMEILYGGETEFSGLSYLLQEQQSRGRMKRVIA